MKNKNNNLTKTNYNNLTITSKVYTFSKYSKMERSKIGTYRDSKGIDWSFAKFWFYNGKNIR